MLGFFAIDLFGLNPTSTRRLLSYIQVTGYCLLIGYTIKFIQFGKIIYLFL